MAKPVMPQKSLNLWQGECSATNVEYRHYWQLLSPAEQDHASSLKLESLHKRYVEVRARLRILLGGLVEEDPKHLRFAKAEFGKPYLMDFPELAFNLSHSLTWIAVIVGYHCELGIDIEQCKVRGSLSALVDKCFAEEEQRYWQQQPESEQTRVFYQFWTRKEAFVKATGKGISLGLNRCVINPFNPATFLRIPDGYGTPADWLIQDIDMGKSMCGAVALKGVFTGELTSRELPK